MQIVSGAALFFELSAIGNGVRDVENPLPPNDLFMSLSTGKPEGK